MTQAPPGWYQDVESWEDERYWNGERWTDAVRPKQREQVLEPPTTATPAPGASTAAAPQRTTFLVSSSGPDSKSGKQMGRFVGWTSGLGGLAIAGASVLGIYLYNHSDDLANSFSDSSLAGDGVIDMSCDDLADEAVRISKDQNAAIRLLKVRESDVVEDNRRTYDVPTGSGEELILSCQGVGVWSTGIRADVKIRLTVDSDGDSFVSYRAVY